MLGERRKFSGQEDETKGVLKVVGDEEQMRSTCGGFTHAKYMKKNNEV